MSQEIGLNFKSRIPTLADDASIEEALRVYHYGVDNYSTQPIPSNSIEGHFNTLTTNVAALSSTVSSLSSSFVRLVSQSASPNIITGQSTTTVPLTIKAIASQTSSLQSWQNSSSTEIASISTGGALGIAGYSSVGSITVSSTIASTITIANASHKGIVVKAAGSQTANLQEWQNSSSTALASISSSGALSANGGITTSSISATSISATTSISSPSIAVTGSQTLDEFRGRNIRASTGQPSGGNDGDIWLVYV